MGNTYFFCISSTISFKIFMPRQKGKGGGDVELIQQIEEAGLVGERIFYLDDIMRKRSYSVKQTS